MADTRLYLISPPKIDLDDFTPILEDALDAGDVACFQLRLKDVDDDYIIKCTKQLMPICHARDIAFILNDRPDLAKILDTDGVHIGQGDGDYKETRALLGADKIIGVTCHNSRHLSMLAGEQGADYVAFGSFFPTETKQTEHQAEISLIEWWIELFEVPCVAIGGITVDNVPPLAQVGTDFIAVSSGVWSHPSGAAQAIAQFNAIFEQ